MSWRFHDTDHREVARPTVLLVHPMLPIELHKLPELISSVSGILPKETHESNRNDRNNCEHHCRNHKEQKEAPTPIVM